MREPGEILDSLTGLLPLCLGPTTFVKVPTQFRSLRSISATVNVTGEVCLANVIFRYLVRRPRSPTWVMKSSSPRQLRQLLICGVVSDARPLMKIKWPGLQCY